MNDDSNIGHLGMDCMDLAKDDQIQWEIMQEQQAELEKQEKEKKNNE